MIKHKYWSVFLILITVLPVIQAKAEVDHENLRYLSGIYHESWAVIIGINEYEHMKDLKYAVNDAVYMKDMFISKYGFKNDHIRLITNEEATRDNITRSFNDLLQKAGEEDRVVVFFAGHG